MARIFNLCIIALITCSIGAGAQTRPTKKNKKPKKAAPAVSIPSTKTQTPTAVETPPKRNERPTDDAKQTTVAANIPTYFYEFTRPGFAYSRILIEHDESGIGKISFQKQGFDEMITDPIRLSAVTLTKINDALAALNFVESTENYQHARDFSNMGNVQIRVKKADRERTAKFNWTDHKNAKVLMDEYRRIGNEGTWRFEITSARENFPLQTPGIMDTLTSYLKRDEISDPLTLLPFLTELSSDERLPLMARNTAIKTIKEIEKTTGRRQ